MKHAATWVASHIRNAAKKLNKKEIDTFHKMKPIIPEKLHNEVLKELQPITKKAEMNDETIQKLTRAIELLTKKGEMEAKRAEEQIKREKMYKEIDEKVRPLRDAKYETLNKLQRTHREVEDKLHDEKETTIMKIENAIRKKYGESEQKPFLRLQNAIKDYSCCATNR
jgi:hypothetical protein